MKAKLYYQFRTKCGREEYHMSSIRKEVENGSNDTLCSSISLSDAGHERWKEECLHEINIYRMKLVANS